MFKVPLSFAKAIILPEKETLPIINPETMVNMVFMLGAAVASCRWENSINEIKPAQAPPIPLNKETISGIFVILTFLAATAPITVPMMIPPTIRMIFIGSKEV